MRWRVDLLTTLKKNIAVIFTQEKHDSNFHS